MPQASDPTGRSIPKVVRVNAADGEAVLYRNLGNGRRLPFIWGTNVTLASGTSEVVVSSGVKFNNHKVSEGIVVVTPLSAAAAAENYYISKDTTANTVTLTTTSSGVASADLNFDVILMLGDTYDFESTHTNQLWK